MLIRIKKFHFNFVSNCNLNFKHWSLQKFLRWHFKIDIAAINLNLEHFERNFQLKINYPTNLWRLCRFAENDWNFSFAHSLSRVEKAVRLVLLRRVNEWSAWEGFDKISLQENSLHNPSKFDSLSTKLNFLQESSPRKSQSTISDFIIPELFNQNTKSKVLKSVLSGFS